MYTIEQKKGFIFKIFLAMLFILLDMSFEYQINGVTCSIPALAIAGYGILIYVSSELKKENKYFNILFILSIIMIIFKIGFPILSAFVLYNFNFSGINMDIENPEELKLYLENMINIIEANQTKLIASTVISVLVDAATKITLFTSITLGIKKLIENDDYRDKNRLHDLSKKISITVLVVDLISALLIVLALPVAVAGMKMAIDPSLEPAASFGLLVGLVIVLSIGALVAGITYFVCYIKYLVELNNIKKELTENTNNDNINNINEEKYEEVIDVEFFDNDNK